MVLKSCWCSWLGASTTTATRQLRRGVGREARVQTACAPFLVARVGARRARRVRLLDCLLILGDDDYERCDDYIKSDRDTCPSRRPCRKYARVLTLHVDGASSARTCNAQHH